MNLGWKILLPLALLNVAVTAVANVVFPDNRWIVAVIGVIVGVVVIVAVASTSPSNRPKSQVTLVRKTS